MKYNSVLFLFLAVLFCAAGCDNRVMLSYRDTPFLNSYGYDGEKKAIKRLNNIYNEDRILALRTLAAYAVEERKKGNVKKAEELTDTILLHYKEDRDKKIRACIIEICLPVCGKNNKKVITFLKKILSEGNWSESVAVTLGFCTDEITILMPLLDHPNPDVRYRGAQAMLLSDASMDKDTADKLRAFMEGMTPASWPATVCRMPLAQARKNLSGMLSDRNGGF